MMITNMMIYTMILMMVGLIYIADKIDKHVTASKSSSNSMIHTNFEKDMEYLNFIINHVCQSQYDNVLKPMGENKTGEFIINDEIFNNVVSGSTKKILSVLSDDYKNVLERYIHKDKLEYFIMDLTINKLLKYTIELNTWTLKKLSRR